MRTAHYLQVAGQAMFTQQFATRLVSQSLLLVAC